MKITCPGCGFEGNMSDKLIPDGGRDIGCPKCGGRFFIRKPRVREIKDPVRDLVEETRLRDDIPPQTEEGIVLREWREFYEKIERLAPPAKRKKIPLIIKRAEDIHENQDLTVQRIEKEVFDVKLKKRNAEITALATRIVRIQGSFNEAEREKRQASHNSDIIGVRLRYEGPHTDGRCPSKACEEALRKGTNVQIDDSRITADFYFDETEVPWFPHCPHCSCHVDRYLYEEDLKV